MTQAQPRDRVIADGVLPSVPFHIVLVEPQIPPNTGNIARVCAATGCALHLVQPLGFSIDDRALKRAGLDYWHALEVVVHESLADFLATPLAQRAWFFSTKAQRVYHEASFALGDALVFGSETKGLPADVLAAGAERALRIPMRPERVRSLNLATSVGIAVYGALAQNGDPGLA